VYGVESRCCADTAGFAVNAPVAENGLFIVNAGMLPVELLYVSELRNGSVPNDVPT
jgi:hypothetical protein